MELFSAFIADDFPWIDMNFAAMAPIGRNISPATGLPIGTYAYSMELSGFLEIILPDLCLILSHPRRIF